MTTAPEKCRASLIIANGIRVERKQIRESIHSPADAAEVVRICQNGMPVVEVLAAIYRWSPERAEAFLDECEIPYLATLGGHRKCARRPLTDRQRDVLASMLESM